MKQTRPTNYLRVPTWAPFRLQFYYNGHNYLAGKLDKAAIAYTIHENAFTSLDDCENAQALSDGFRVDDLKQALDIFAARYCPVIKKFELAYHWSIMQVEYATDIMFKERDYLGAIYEPLIRTAIHSVKPENIATFLGRKLHPVSIVLTKHAGSRSTKIFCRWEPLLVVGQT